MKKIWVFILVVSLFLFAGLIGCQRSDGKDAADVGEKTGDKVESEGNEAAESNLTPKGTFPIVKEKVTMSVLMSTTAPNVPESWVTKFYEEKTNIHIDWQIIPRDGAVEKISLMLASRRDLPEIIISGQSGAITPDLAYSYGQEGLFLPLNDLIDEHCVFLHKAFEYAPDFRRQMTAPDGEIYGLWGWEECFHCEYHQRAYINVAWLDNLGLEMPGTTDDLIQVLRAFRDQDANGNGDPNDEIPLTAVQGWGGAVDGFLSNPFIYNDGEDRLYVEDDKVIATFVQSEFKDALKYIKKLYDENLLDKEAFNTDQATAKMLTGAEKGNRIGMAITAIPHFVDFSTGRQLEYEVLLPLTGPTGLKQTAYYPMKATGPKAVITNECKDPVVAIRWLDGMYDEEDLNWMGEPGVHVREGQPGDIAFTGEQAWYMELGGTCTEEQLSKRDWGWAQPYLRTHAFRHGMGYDPNVYNAEKVLYDNAVAYEKYKPEGRMSIPYLFYETEEMKELAELKETINTYVNENIAAFIVGRRDIDNHWDDYIKELEDIGLSRYLEIIQNAYDAQIKK